MNASIKKHSTALASLLALGLMGCGTSDPNCAKVGPDTVIDPPTVGGQIAHPPVVNFGFFDPKTEDELKGVVAEGEFAGSPIANYGCLIAKVKAGFNPANFESYGLEVRGSMSANGAKYYFLQKDSDLVETMNKVRLEMGGLMFIEPDVAHYTTAAPVEFKWDKPDALVANQMQYGVLVTQTLRAWQAHGFGPNRVVVCDIDTGVNYNHEDLTNIVKHAYSWYNAAGTAVTDFTGNPYDDQDPTDFRVTAPGAATGTDTGGNNKFHGTHTAGIIAAEGNNGKGIAGMCWNADMVHYRCFSNTSGNTAWTIYGSLWHLAKWKKTNYPHTIPVNMSLTSFVPSQFAADMVEMALENDMVICASSGNDYSGLPVWPGSFTGVIRVGATDYRDRRALFSNWGQDLSVVAPGYDVYSCDGGNSTGYWLMNGTSMAAPHVTGLVGYMLTFEPDLKPDQIRTYIEQNCDPIDEQKGHSVHTGWGRINTYKTIAAVKAGTLPSNYVMSPVKITVEDMLHSPLANVSVYLYNCDQSGAITNYAGSTITGSSFVEVRNDLDSETEPGVARFNGLKPGYYKAVASPVVLDMATGKTVPASKSTPVFEIKRGVAVPDMNLTIDGFEPLFIQTLPTSNTARQNTDTRMAVYNHVTNAALLDYNAGTFDTILCKMPTEPGTYWIRIYPTGTTTYGEYALWLSTNGVKPWPAPGTFANAGIPSTPGEDGIKGGQTTTRTVNSQLVEVDSGKFVYGDFTTVTGHYYRFVVPEPAP